MARSYRLAERGQPPIDLPAVLRDHDAPFERIGGQTTTLSGNRVSHTLAWKRSWTLPFGPIGDPDWETVRAWTDPNVHGLGPFELYEDDHPPVLVTVDSLERVKNIRGLSTVTLTLREV